MAGYKVNRKPKQDQIKKTYNGETVKPCLYVRTGGSKIMCGQIEEGLLLDSNGNAIPWRQIPYETWTIPKPEELPEDTQ